MADDEQSSGKYNVQFGDVSQSQIVLGDYNTVRQKFGLTPQDVAELGAAFNSLRSAIAEQVSPQLRGEAMAQAGELECAVVSEHPEPSRARKVLTWFRDNAPQVVGAVLSVVVNPLVGKIAEAAGNAVADGFRDIAEESEKGTETPP